MTNGLISVNPTQFIHFAGHNIDRWKMVLDMQVTHSAFGRGKISAISGTGQSISLEITFIHPTDGKTTRKFASSGLEKCENLLLPISLASKVIGLQVASKEQKVHSKEEVRCPKSCDSSQNNIRPGSNNKIYTSGYTYVGPKKNNKQKDNIKQLDRPDTIYSRLQSSGSDSSAQYNPRGEADNQPPMPKFAMGQEVMVLKRLGLRGVIYTMPFLSQGEWQYEVFISAHQKQIYRESDLSLPKDNLSWSNLDDMLRNLALVKMRKPLRDNLYALYGSRTQFEVYQFKPALKFLANPDQRLLIADEVGLGKTIEAGIIFLELQARLELNRVLIVCPSGLRAKWQDEMKLRFDEEFAILDMEGMRKFIQHYQQLGNQARLRGIVSLELLRRPELVEVIESQHILFDLVIIDEAHHCRNTSTLSNEIATILSENADAMLLLTATPLQMGNQDLFNLLHILSPGEFDDFEAFINRLEPNQYVNRASQILATGDHRKALEELKKVEHTSEKQRFVGNPYYADVTHLLDQDWIIKADLVKAQRRIIELNTLASIFTRTRKREIAEKVPTRAAFNLKVYFSAEERLFYNRVIQYVREEFELEHGSSFASGWVSIMRERQTASCISAARKRFTEIDKLIGLSSEEESFLDHNIVGDWQNDEIGSTTHRQKNSLLSILSKSDRSTTDSKFDIFINTLQEVLNEDMVSKIIVFSFFRDTIEYLYSRLLKLGIGISRLHGGFKVPDRQSIIDQFRSNPQIRVLISSDVGAEGLDFQFCNTIFNYDLPWNPMKVEQRIGRIDRFGQQSSRIRIYNLVIEDSIESRILMRLYDRIGIFTQSIGDIEAILGEEVRELSKKVYSLRLTSDEEKKLTEQAAANILRRQQEMEEFEKQRMQFMGQEAIFSTLVNQTIESGNYISEPEVRGLVQTFLEDNFQHSRLEWDESQDHTAALEVNDDLATYLRGFILDPKRNDLTAQEFLKLLIPGKCIPVTFSSSLAYQRKLLEFITFRHPLAQAATIYWKEQIHPASSLAYFGLKCDEFCPGDYFFFVYTLDSHGAEQNTRLVSVAIVPGKYDVYTSLSNQFLRLVQTSAVALNVVSPKVDLESVSQAEETARIFMTLRRDEIEKDILRSNAALVNARLSALTQSYEAKRRRVEIALEKSLEPRIRRMREGQMRNLEAIYKSKIQEMAKQNQVSVSYSLALRGVVQIIN